MLTARAFMAGPALVTALFTAVVPGAASATPSHGANSKILLQSSNSGRDFSGRDLTIDPGGSTGWHWQDGTVVGIVKQGTLTHYSADCQVDGVYHVGDPITEPSGPNHIHIDRNIGSEPLVLAVIYSLPAGKPLAEDAPNPGCEFD
jgi:quercetin dioxygenase-like cupin family protein